MFQEITEIYFLREICVGGFYQPCQKSYSPFHPKNNVCIIVLKHHYLKEKTITNETFVESLTEYSWLFLNFFSNLVSRLLRTVIKSFWLV